MRRTVLPSAVLLIVALLVPGVSSAAPGDRADLHVTYRGATPWLSSADVVGATEGAATLAITGRLGAAEVTHPVPAGAAEVTTYDLTDAVPVPADAAMSVTHPNGESVDLAGTTVGFGPAADEVSGVAGPGDTVEVSLVSGPQSLTTSVAADATTGAYTASFPAFDGTWEFGASIAAAVTAVATDGTAVTMHVARRLPGADVTTQLVSEGPPASYYSEAVFFDITPGEPFTAVGEPTSLTAATTIASFDPDADTTVEHLGRTLEIGRPTLSVDAADFSADAVLGIAPAFATVDVLVASDAGVQRGTVTAGGDGAWRFDLTGDASVFARVDAAIDHTDGARHHARGEFGDDEAGSAPVLAYLVLPADTMLLLAFADGEGDTYDVEITWGSGTVSTGAFGTFELFGGVSSDDFDPPVDFASGMDIRMDQGGTVSTVRVPRLDWTVDASGAITGSTDVGRRVDFMVDVPVAGIGSSTATGGGDGSFSVVSTAPFTPGSEITATILPELNATSEIVYITDRRLAAPIEHVVGASGGRAPGLGNNAVVLEQLELIASTTRVPATWRMDAVAPPGGSAGLTVRFPSTERDSAEALFGTGPVTPVPDAFTLEVISEGSELDTAPPGMVAYVPVNVDDALGAVVRAPAVLVDEGAGNVEVPAAQVTVCLTSGDDCDDFPVPYVRVTDAPVGTYRVVDDGGVPNRMTVDRVYGGPDTGRIETAVALSQATFPQGGADAVVIANSRDFPDALAATPIAAAATAPVLLNPSDRLHPAVEAEIERLGVKRAYVMGGEAAMSRDVVLALGRDAGVQAVTRVAGADRYATAAAAAQVAVDLWKAQGDSSAGSEVLVALGRHDADPNKAWPDALVAGQVAAYAHQPILLTAQGGVPGPTNAALADLGTKTVTVVGGPAAIPDSTKEQLGAPGTNRLRIAGADRYATGAALADEAYLWGADDSTVLIATGLAFPDGLTAAAAAYHQGGVLLLAHGADAGRSQATLAWLDDRAGDIGRLRAIGGPAAISDAVLDSLVASAATSGTTVDRRQSASSNRTPKSARWVGVWS